MSIGFISLVAAYLFHRDPTIQIRVFWYSSDPSLRTQPEKPNLTLTGFAARQGWKRELG